VLKRPGINFWSVNVSTDRRKPVVANVNGEIGCNREGDCDRSVGVEMQVRPASNISLTVGPSFNHSESGFGYVTSLRDTIAPPPGFGGFRYVFSDLRQNEIAMNTRFNVTFTPNLTFELFLQPLISAGDYSRFKEFAAPRSLQKLVYGEDIGTVTIQPGSPRTYVIHPDGAAASDSFAIQDPNFTFRSLRGNAVLRWEYRPGSTLYLVWTRSSASSLSRGTIDFGDDSDALFRGPAENIFLLKVNFWLGM
jgi:hypothetical protein